MTETFTQWHTMLIILMVTSFHTKVVSDTLGKYNPCSTPGLATVVCPLKRLREFQMAQPASVLCIVYSCTTNNDRVH